MAASETPPPPAPSSAHASADDAAPNLRRSISIFSRRCTPPNLPPEWRVSKMFRRRLESNLPEGTILRAVPRSVLESTPEYPSIAASMGAMELAAAASQNEILSPNEEILSAISLPGPLRPYPPASPHSFSAECLTPAKRRLRKSSDGKSTMIGVWKDGRTQWMPGNSSTLALGPSKKWPLSSSNRDHEAMIPLPAPAVTSQKSQRPSIQVVIPSGRLNKSFSSVPFRAESASASAAFPPSPVEMPAAPIARSPVVRRPLMPFSKLQDERHLMVELPAVPSHGQRPSFSNISDSSRSHSDAEDDRSVYSNRSSTTSVESHEAMQHPKPNFLLQRTGSVVFSIRSPAAAGVFDESWTDDAATPIEIAELEGSSPPPVTRALPRMASSSTACAPRRRRMSSRRGTRILSAPHSRANSITAKIPSPTLSDAERQLERTLGSIDKVNHMGRGDALRTQNMVPPLPPLSDEKPCIPRKSSRRAVRPRSVIVPTSQPLSKLYSTRGKSLRMPYISELLHAETPEFSNSIRPVTPALERGLREKKRQEKYQREREHREKVHREIVRQISAQQAEDIILHIMQSLPSLDDLVNTAGLNKGFYRVFKRHELELFRGVLKTENLAAWEYMENGRPQEAQFDHEGNPISARPSDFDASSYRKFYKQSLNTLAQLKALILAKCQSFIRKSTAAALASKDPKESATVDAAFWRIWTFCRIFGSNSSREDDIVGQMDWLRGGPLAHQQTCTSTIVSSDSFYTYSVLLGAPEHFARGNGKSGLSADSLYDMTELWNCFNWLVLGLQGRTEQARQFGVFDNTDIRGGDIDGEEAMLEEFQAYILTLGLEPLLIMASALLPANDTVTIDDIATDPTVLALAKKHGWTSWKPPAAGRSRSTFLKEPLTRLYEERIAAAFASPEEQRRRRRSEEMRQLRRSRGEQHAAELRNRKKSINCEEAAKPRRNSKFADEQLFSDWQLVVSRLTGPRQPRPMRVPPADSQDSG